MTDPFARHKNRKFDMKLKTHRYDTFSRPIYDLAGMHQIDTGSTLAINSPLDCLADNLMLEPYKDMETTYWPPEK